MNIALDQLRNDSQQLIDELQQQNELTAELQSTLSRSCRSIKRSLTRFDSKLVLMATIGSVKSGKSTLTNCLTRRQLCATKLGIETTKLPLIILASDDGTERIELYSPMASKSLNEQELFELVIDHLRGIASEEFEQKIAIDRRPLSQNNLDAWALGQTAANCAAIYLVEPDAKILQAGFGIIDMPGMDGLSSNWQDEKLHSWMNQNADYFMLVQSSFAALTPDTRSYIKEAMERSPRPIRIVQNRIEAQYWLGSEQQHEQQDIQQLNTQKQLGDFLHKIIPGSWVNAGLAWWKQENKYAALSHSEYQSNLAACESAILNDLRNPEHTLRLNSMDYLHKSLEDCDDNLKTAQRHAEDHISFIHQISNDVQRLLDSAQLRDAIESCNLHEGRMRCKYLSDEVKEKLNRRLDDILNLEIDGYFPAEWIGKKLSGEQLNSILGRVEIELAELASQQESAILSPDKICELTDLERSKITSCADILKRRDAKDIEQDYSKAVLQAWQHIPLESSPIRLGNLKESRMLGLMERMYSYNETSADWRIEGRQAIAERLKDWSKLVLEQLESFINKRINAMKDCLQLELSRYQESEQLGRSQKLAEQDIAHVKAIRAKLAPILHAARQFSAIK